MKGLNPVLEDMKNGINGAKDTRQAIITAANSYEYIQKAIKEFEKNALKKNENEKPETIHFDPNEIEPIVLKDRFKENLKVKQQKPLETQSKTTVKSRKNKEERDIG